MDSCECLPGCPFYNERMKDQPGMSSIYRKNYCLGGFNRNCARYMVRKVLGGDRVPVDLYPNQIDRAVQLIRQG